MRHLMTGLILGGILTIGWGFLTTSAQARWSVWLYHADSGDLLRVDQSGQTIQSQVRITDDVLAPEQIIIAPDGERAAYLTHNNQTIIIADLADNRQQAVIDLTDVQVPSNQDDYLYLSATAFDLSGQYLVYTEVLGGLVWQLHIYDIAAQAITQTLRYNDASTHAYPALHGGVLPIVSAITDDHITFTVDIDYPVAVRSYHWFYQENTLRETVAAPSLEARTWGTTGDLVSPLYDPHFPAENDTFRLPFLQRNSLQAYTFRDGRFPIFSDPILSLERIWFVQGGERLLLQTYTDPIHRGWLLINRDGSRVRPYARAGSELHGTPDGFVYRTDVDEQTAIVTVETASDSAGRTLWIGSGMWHILWAGRNHHERPLPNFVPSQTAVQDPIGIVNRYSTPTPAPSPPAFRQIGMAIQIFVIENGYLNLRAEPSLQAEALTLLESGTRGTIIDGPVSADGYVWWQIEVGNRRGWVVDELPDNIALIPPQVLPSITPTPTPSSRP